ncbi:MAG: 50S ribosome-binding GTPase [Candidatus Peribacteria bacterium]|jgi:GTP-binding protein|nr:50S ribosome-binding GTPase [Candidatus Peribacteria bacterium]
MKMLITSAQFITSATNLSQCPPPLYPEFAFFGRSNVGKSSLINMLTQRKSLAKASNTPGKTRLLNFFLINNQWQIVDLP